MEAADAQGRHDGRGLIGPQFGGIGNTVSGAKPSGRRNGTTCSWLSPGAGELNENAASRTGSLTRRQTFSVFYLVKKENVKPVNGHDVWKNRTAELYSAVIGAANSDASHRFSRGSGPRRTNCRPHKRAGACRTAWRTWLDRGAWAAWAAWTE